MKWITALALGMAVSALAGLGWAAVEDADRDGMISFAEAQAAFPSLTEDTFAEIDGDGDGMLSMEEVAAAEEAGLLVTDG